MSLSVRFSGSGSVNFERCWADADVHAVRKFIRAFKAACNSEVFEIYDLEREVTFLKPRLTGELPD